MGSDKPMTSSTETAADVRHIGERTDETIKRLGMSIRRHRKMRGKTLQDVATATGLSVSMLSMLERGLAGASIGSLITISTALDVPMHELFDVSPSQSGPLRRRAGQTTVEAMPGVLRRTVHSEPSHGLETVVLELAPGSDTGEHPLQHSGREYAVVTQGRVTLELGDASYRVDTGDGMVYAADQPHRIANEGDTTAQIIFTVISD